MCIRDRNRWARPWPERSRRPPATIAGGPGITLNGRVRGAKATRIELERDLAADLNNPWIENLRRQAPLRPVGAIHRTDRAGVQGVIGIEVRLDTDFLDLEGFGEPQ